MKTYIYDHLIKYNVAEHMKVKCLQRKKGSKKDILRKEIDPQKHLLSPVYFTEASLNQ